MKKLIITLAIIFCFWPQRQARTQQVHPQQEQKQPDTLNRNPDKKVKKHILDNFSSLETEIDRISHLQKKYIVRTKTLSNVVVKGGHRHRIDTVLLFIDTCFSRTDTLLLPSDTFYTQKPKEKFFQKIKNIFHRKKPLPKDDLRIVPAYF